MRRLKTLLLQARRADDPMRDHELRCFVSQTPLEAEQIAVHNLVDGAPTLEAVRHYDAIFVGGSGDYYCSKRNLPDFEGFLQLLRGLAEHGRPTFASCFGYQAMVLALGGEILHDPPNTEVGTYDLQTTPAAEADPLFQKLPQRFKAQMGHKDRASRLPDGIPNFAASQRCPYQALRIPEKPVWATQFHPELTEASNRERFLHYLDGYAYFMSPEERARSLERFKPSPESSNLLDAFLRLVFT